MGLRGELVEAFELFKSSVYIKLANLLIIFIPTALKSINRVVTSSDPAFRRGLKTHLFNTAFDINFYCSVHCFYFFPPQT